VYAEHALKSFKRMLIVQLKHLARARHVLLAIFAKKYINACNSFFSVRKSLTHRSFGGAKKPRAEFLMLGSL
jgi:hypothetical protein